MIDAKTASALAVLASSLRMRFGLPSDPVHRGPVPLSRFLEEFNLLHVTLPRLTRTAIAEHLLGEGIGPGKLVDTGDPEELFAGFIFTTASVGFVFVAETEPVSSEATGQLKLKPTPLGRWRFTAAHELGHFLLHRDRMVGGQWIGDTKETIQEEDGAGTNEMEREANRFAAELLMPADVCWARAKAFKAAYRVCPLTAFAYQLSSELLVSPEAMRNRLRGLEVGDE